MLVTMLGIRNRYGGGMIDPDPDPGDERAALARILGSGRPLLNRVLPGHVQVVRRLLFDPLTHDALHPLGDIMTRVRDHMRARPPRSARLRVRTRNRASP